MSKDVDSQVKIHSRAHHRRRTWHRVVTTLACLVVFITTYALVLPAITLESTPDTYCGMEEHRHGDECWEVPGEDARTEITCGVSAHSHTAECYDESGNIVCAEADYIVHRHDSFCFNDAGELICSLPEQDLHEHDASCYDESGRVTCGKSTPLTHQHTVDCVTEIPATEPQGLICGIAEHTHTEACLEAEFDTGLLEALQGKRMSELTEDERLALRTLALAEISEDEMAMLSEEDISELMLQALVSLGGLSDEEEEDLSDKSLLEMTGAELASLTDEEIAARTEEFLALTDEEFNALNQRMSQAANEAVASASYGDAISDSEESILLGLANETTARTVAVDLSGTLTITDDVSNSGCYIVSYSGGLDGVTFKWYRTDAGGTENAVARKYYRVGGVVTSNLSGDSLQNLNLALDSGGITSSRSSVKYRVVLYADGEKTDIEATITNTTHQGEVLNGSFESPDLTRYDYQEFVTEGTAGLYWKTTAENEETGNSVYSGGTSQTGAHYIEIVDTSSRTHKRNATQYHGQGSAADGDQYAELNAGAFGALYQTVITTPGTTMNWSVAHSGRNGTDTMAVVIMSEQTAKNYTTQAQLTALLNSTSTDSNVTIVKSLTASKGTWTTHSGTYTIPAGQYETRFFFVSQATYNNQATVGNHIDNVWFSTEAPAPAPNDAKLTLGKHVYGELDETELNELLMNLQFKLIDVSDNSLLRTVNAYELGTWSKISDGHYELGKTISISGLVGKTIRVEESGYELDGFDVQTELTTAAQFTVETQEEYSANFKNTYTVPNCTVKVTKHISSSDTSGTYEIHVSYQDGDADAVDQSFMLGNDASGTVSVIPPGAVVTVSEPTHDGYTVRITDRAGTLLADSDWYSFTITEDTEIHIYNTAGVILPQTGGESPSLFIYGGLFLMLTAVMTGFILRRKWGKEETE